MDKIKKIAQAIDEYANKNKSPDYEELIGFVMRKTSSKRPEVEEVVDFLRECQGIKQLPAPLEALNIDLSKPLDVGDEIQFNYAVARGLLERIINTQMPDSEEIRKTLREIQRFLETMIKMQEKVYNIQQIIKFQEAVFEVMSEHVDREVIVGKMLELSS